MRVLPRLVLLVSSLPIGGLGAQQPAPTQGTATANIVGGVYDSIHARVLVGARIRVDTSGIIGVTDSTGRFHIEGVPAGAHGLRLEHPLLDTLGVVLRTPPELYAAGETKPVDLSIPTAETVVQMLCSAAWRARGPSALMGRVRDAETGSPAVGAKVSLVWYEIDITGGIRKAPRVRETTVTPDGTYRICGLPAGLEGKVQVIRGALTSGDIPVSFGESPLVLRSMGIASPAAVAAGGDSTAPKATVMVGSARLTGKVVNKSGQPLVGARIQLEGTTRATSTRSSGEFVLDSLPSGTQTVSVRLLGYTPVEQAVDLSSREPKNITLLMDNFVPVLAEVRVSAQRDRALDDVGFSRRKRQGMGWYMDPDEAKRHANSLYFSDVVRVAPGIRVSSVGGTNRQVIQSTRDPLGGCVNVYVDGTMWQQLEPGDVDDFIKPYELGALEVYSGSTTPAEFQPAGRGNCTTIVAWTLRRLERKR